MAESRGGRGANLGGQVSDVVELVKAYVLQETIDPLRGAARFIAFGLAGAVLIVGGTIMLLVGLLRFLQTRDLSAFHDDWSFVPYLITLVPCLACIALALSRITKTGLDRTEDRK